MFSIISKFLVNLLSLLVGNLVVGVWQIIVPHSVVWTITKNTFLLY